MLKLQKDSAISKKRLYLCNIIKNKYYEERKRNNKANSKANQIG